MIIDAKNLIVGRLATFAAKKALLGEGIVIVNCDKAVISGEKRSVLMNAKKDSDRGTPSKGPFIPKQSHKFVKRIVRGMIPYKQPKGAAAFNRIKCYNDIPDNFNDQKIETVQIAHLSRLNKAKYVEIKEICKHLGGKS